MDSEFKINVEGLTRAVSLLSQSHDSASLASIPDRIPEAGIDHALLLDSLAKHVLGGAARLGTETAFAHMDPPTPWITWAMAMWNASLNQNLLHPATSPVAKMMEERVMQWLAPYFGMTGGHMTPGSTVANLTALWAARDCAGVTEVVTSDAAHLSVAKAAHLLGLRLIKVPVHKNGAMVADEVPTDLSKSALVLTAGTTSTGAIDPLQLAGRAAWTHVDAAWAGPLRLTRHASRLEGIENADSVAVSAHKWLFQPKESALILFKDVNTAHAAVSFGGAYLAAPNVGVLGSHGANAVPLLATLMSWGREGLAARIERCVDMAMSLANHIKHEPSIELRCEPETAVVVWRPRDPTILVAVSNNLPVGLASQTTLDGERWFRNVAANPSADIELIKAEIDKGVARSQAFE